jgi:hypothetical protein
MVERHRLRSGIEPPWLFPNDAAWSAYLRKQPGLAASLEDEPPGRRH